MFFDIQALKREKIRFDHAYGPGSIDLLDEGLRQVGDLQISGIAELLDPFGAREIHVCGRFRGGVEVPCARCLDPIQVDVSGPVDLYYRPLAQIPREEEFALSDDESEVGFYQEGGLELADVVREQVVMGLPMRSLCREECLGICPHCGVNRNRESCACRLDFSDPRWDRLRDWK